MKKYYKKKKKPHPSSYTIPSVFDYFIRKTFENKTTGSVSTVSWKDGQSQASQFWDPPLSEEVKLLFKYLFQ